MEQGLAAFEQYVALALAVFDNDPGIRIECHARVVSEYDSALLADRSLISVACRNGKLRANDADDHKQKRSNGGRKAPWRKSRARALTAADMRPLMAVGLRPLSVRHRAWDQFPNIVDARECARVPRTGIQPFLESRLCLQQARRVLQTRKPCGCLG